jgi:hypothetical protein
VRLDNYDPDDIDDQEFEQMDPAERARVEAILARRDAERARAAGRIPEAFMDGMRPLYCLILEHMDGPFSLAT